MPEHERERKHRAGPRGSSPRWMIVGLTGGIASGKSTVADEFARLGIPVLDTDQIARDVVAPGSPGLEQLRKEFGQEILNPDGELDRARLRARVFADDHARRRLEAITHPLIRQELVRRAMQAGGPYQIHVIPLLVVFKHATVELKKLLYPTLIQPVTVANRTVTQSTMEGILGFFLLYIMTTVGASMLVLATGVDLVTGVTAVISAMNSIGPGLGEVGPSGNYSGLPDYCKGVLSVCMLVGRLEIYTIFVLFHPAFWRH